MPMPQGVYEEITMDYIVDLLDSTLDRVTYNNKKIILLFKHFLLYVTRTSAFQASVTFGLHNSVESGVCRMTRCKGSKQGFRLPAALTFRYEVPRRIDAYVAKHQMSSIQEHKL